ncbi:MAG: Uma2 family endonuclease [Methylovulum sp.]|uniref:Uma2 family endonuclease n=1 Tax=Methylovulum sp. TaxID=1916980 RepID=UPI0026035C7E|nr:Uma2 family endonuclease [Methylovulum sp.]MDD2725019.1 Uma2 family endonuclease [Methylovulum sp.]MDD5125412.1 Uma2 family endonuclease [Methylovulum sp.]
MVANLKQEPAWMSEEEYLRTEVEREIKHEYIDGYIYAMAGVKKNHQRITVNLSSAFRIFLHGKPCEPFASDVKVKVGSKFFYPDVMVVCEDNNQDYYTETPVIIVEVLSKSTRRLDETIKKLAYQNIPSLQEYVLIEQDFVDVEVCRRSQAWVSSHYFLGDSVLFEAIGLEMTVADIYERVENEDMQTFLAQAETETIIP